MMHDVYYDIFTSISNRFLFYNIFFFTYRIRFVYIYNLVLYKIYAVIKNLDTHNIFPIMKLELSL